MFYTFIRAVAAGVVWLVNGRFEIHNADKLPTGNYILVGPHRTWWDPIYFALAAWPTRFMFMAKIELFKNPILRYILTHANAFPVDRANPGPSVIKMPVQKLKKSNLSLIMFPTGSRHSQAMKGGVMMIAKLSGVPVVPMVYQGPVKLSGLFKRNNVKMSYGDPIYVDKKTKLSDENMQAFGLDLQSAFDQIDHDLDPNFVYIDPKPKATN